MFKRLLQLFKRKALAQLSDSSTASSSVQRDDGRDLFLEPKHKIFLSHSGAQKAFVEHLCVELERCLRFPFFDKLWESLPIGENFLKHIFDAIQQCHVGVVILSEEFFTSKWPMMELVAMVEHAEKKNSTFIIMPVYLYTSLREFKDPINRTRWRSLWHELALENPARVKVENWEYALKYLSSISGLMCDGLSELRFQKVIVDAICRIVPTEIRLEDSHIQGRTQLYKVIQDKIDVQRNFRINGICVVGLYGVGGIGKTSICKALCNEFFMEFRGRVCLVELEIEKKLEVELLRKVVRNLSDTSREHLDGLNEYQLRNGVKEGIFIREPVFLALNNILDTDASIEQAKRYLSAKLPLGSIMMVTSRSKELLLHMRQYINENNCIEMPEMDMEEAKSLFAKSSDFERKDEFDEDMLECCVKRCCFQKYDHSQSYQYHPLALNVLGRQLGCIGPRDWRVQLDMIDGDIFNRRGQNDHPIFSILRKSFGTLSLKDQLLFMDVALFLPQPVEGGCNMFEWLGMVHNIDDVKSWLERLKRKSLLETFGDGIKSRIGMHDLWRSFCVAETEYGELGCRRWVYESERTHCELVYTTPSSIWQNVKRMAFLGSTSRIFRTFPGVERSLERVNFAHFSNVSVLKITDLCMKRKAKLDLSGLIHLKSLEVSGRDLGKLVLQGLLYYLIFLSLRWDELEELESDFSQDLLKQIECLEELKYLELINYGGDKLPDMSRMVSICKATFHYCRNVVTLTGLGSQLTNLRVLDLQGCWELQRCPGVEYLVGLEELNCRGCKKLAGLPDLRMLRNLLKLDVDCCECITELVGLGDLVLLVELYAGLPIKQSISFEVPDMRNLRNLQVLHFGGRRLEAVPGFDSLVSLRKVVADFQNVVDRPSLLQLTKLEKLKINGLSLAGLGELDKLTMLHSLEIVSCSNLDELPDFRSLIILQTLKIVDCEFKDVSGLSNLSALESLQIEGCNMLERIPDLQRLTSLKLLEIRACTMLRGWDCTFGRVEDLSSSRLDVTSVGFDLLDSQRLMGLRTLTLFCCVNLSDVTSIGAFSQLETLDCWELGVRELPDLSNFSLLKNLTLWKCEFLEMLTIREPMNALLVLLVHGCHSLVTLPDLCNFPGLLELRLEEGEITTLSCSVPLPALQLLGLRSSGVIALPDMGMYFPAVKEVELGGSIRLTTLISSLPLYALQVLKLTKCSGLKALPDLGMFPALESLDLYECLQLLKLSCSVPLPALRELDARKCKSLSGDDIDNLRALCPQCYIRCTGYPQCYIKDEDIDEDVEETCLSRLLGFPEDGNGVHIQLRL